MVLGRSIKGAVVVYLCEGGDNMDLKAVLDGRNKVTILDFSIGVYEEDGSTVSEPQVIYKDSGGFVQYTWINDRNGDPKFKVVD